VKNPLLVNSDSDETKKKEAEDILENISHCDVITDNNSNKAKTKIGQLCFENNINIFDIFEIEEQIDKELENISKAQSIDTVFNTVDYLFFSKINDNQGEYNNLKRLREHEAQNFYKMLINWRIMGFTMKVMIDEVVGYWNTLRGEQSRTVYVGKWGDKTRGGHREYWTDITEKDEYEKVNLAIVRLKEEYDFIDNEIIKYVEILHSLELIEESLYLKIKYGTDDIAKIALLNCGISSSLSKLLQEKYSNMFTADINNSSVIFSQNLISEMVKNNENGVLISEVKMNVQE
jgi:DEAD/DEAH box helicase